MKSFLKIVSIALIFSTIFYSFNTKHMNFYSFSAKDIDGNTVDFSKFTVRREVKKYVSAYYNNVNLFNKEY